MCTSVIFKKTAKSKLAQSGHPVPVMSSQTRKMDSSWLGLKVEPRNCGFYMEPSDLILFARELSSQPDSKTKTLLRNLQIPT
jgi:hypothetical protein